jgi:hypothetical protein
MIYLASPIAATHDLNNWLALDDCCRAMRTSYAGEVTPQK